MAIGSLVLLLCCCHLVATWVEPEDRSSWIYNCSQDHHIKAYSQTCQAPSYKQPRIQSVLPLGCSTIVSFIFSASGPAWAALHYWTLGILQRAQSPEPQQSPALSALRRKRLFHSLEKGKEIKLLGNQEQSHVCVINMSHIVVSPKCFHLAKPKGEALSQRFLLFGTYYQFKSA